MPWETARAQRVLNLQTAEALQFVPSIESALAHHQPTSRLSLQAAAVSWHPLVQSTPLLSMLSNYYSSTNAERWLDGQAQRSATLLILAIEAYRLEHGALPGTLDELVGPYLTQMPRDPYSGDNFRYYPQGIQRSFTNRWSHAILPQTPFLWSCGQLLLPVTSGQQGDNDQYLRLGWQGVVTSDRYRFPNFVGSGLTFILPGPTPPAKDVDNAAPDDKAASDDAESPANDNPADTEPAQAPPAPPALPDDNLFAESPGESQ
jgi:type II secretory pathway pseudopilin PulG